MQYPLHFEPDDNGTILVTCPVLPEVTTFGDDKAGAFKHGREAVEEALGARIAQWSEVSVPSRDDLAEALNRGEAVALSSLATFKLKLYLACRQNDVTRADLARRLGWHREQVDRLFRFNHATRLDQFDAAFAAIGRQVQVETTELMTAA